MCVGQCVYPFYILNKSIHFHGTSYEHMPLDDKPML